MTTQSTEENKAIVRRNFEEAWNKMNLDVVDELFATDYMGYFAVDSKPVSGIEACKQFMSGYFVAFPDAHFDIEDMFGEGEKVVARWTVRGTHKGNLGPIPPTGKRITVPGIWILRVVGGKIVEQWGINDTFGLMQQLGVVPTPG
jgi:steroid delta-isomerase-like uncharacterized protein